MNVAELTAAGLYDPAAPDAAERLRLLEWLGARGANVAQMAEAERVGGLLQLAGRLASRPGPYLTTAESAARIGMPTADFEAFCLDFGLPPSPPDTRLFTEAEAQSFGHVVVGVELFGLRPMRRLARVIGSSLARITEALVSTNRESRMAKLATEESSEVAKAEAYLAALSSSDAPVRMIEAILPLHLELAGLRSRHGRRSFTDETVYACVGFVDLVGFTTLSRQLSAAELAAVVERFEEVAHAIATARYGRVVKFIGDEVMFVTTDAAAACDIALALIEEFVHDPAVTPRGGLAAGELLDRGGDYYGPVVNLAARLADVAVPREVLVSEEVGRAAASPSLHCDPAGRRKLRGFDVPVDVLSVARA